MLSCFAAIAGLLLLLNNPQTKDDLEIVDLILLRMSFAYWLVYCGAVAVKPFIPSDWDIVCMSVKLTGALAYLLTATCVISLPLHRVASRQPE